MWYIADAKMYNKKTDVRVPMHSADYFPPTNATSLIIGVLCALQAHRRELLQIFMICLHLT